MKRRAAISGLEKPSRANRAICASWVVRSSCVSDDTFADTAAGGLAAPRSARRANASRPILVHISYAVRSCSRASDASSPLHRTAASASSASAQLRKIISPRHSLAILAAAGAS